MAHKSRSSKVVDETHSCSQSVNQQLTIITTSWAFLNWQAASYQQTLTKINLRERTIVWWALITLLRPIASLCRSAGSQTVVNCHHILYLRCDKTTSSIRSHRAIDTSLSSLQIARKSKAQSKEEKDRKCSCSESGQMQLVLFPRWWASHRSRRWGSMKFRHLTCSSWSRIKQRPRFNSWWKPSKVI